MLQGQLQHMFVEELIKLEDSMSKSGTLQYIFYFPSQNLVFKFSLNI